MSWTASSTDGWSDHLRHSGSMDTPDHKERERDNEREIHFITSLHNSCLQFLSKYEFIWLSAIPSTCLSVCHLVIHSSFSPSFCLSEYSSHHHPLVCQHIAAHPCVCVCVCLPLPMCSQLFIWPFNHLSLSLSLSIIYT